MSFRTDSVAGRASDHVFTVASELRSHARRLREIRKKEIAMTVRDVMRNPVTTCRTETNLAAASALMWDNGCGALPAFTETGELAGILTDRDICIALGTRNARASDLTVRDVVETRQLSCKPSDDILTALLIMHQAKIRILPVVDEAGVLEGLVSIDDIVSSVLSGDPSALSGDSQFASQRAAA
jgi:CBS domain-containing protein